MLADKAEQNATDGAADDRVRDGQARSGKSGSKVRSVIGGGVTVMGNLVSAGEIEVEGEVEGNVKCKSVLIGDKARVAGGVAADDVVVLGRVDGSIRGEFVMLKSGSRVDAELYYNSLVIHQGAVFDGSSRYTPNPMAEAASSKPADRGQARVMDHQKGSTKSA